jgi:hypothetical protein
MRALADFCLYSCKLPVRLAHRVQDLDELPEGLSKMPSIQRVRDWYAESFEVRPSLLPG